MSSSGNTFNNLNTFLNSVERAVSPGVRNDKFLERLPKFHYYDLKLTIPTAMNIDCNSKKVVKLRFMHDPDLNLYAHMYHRAKPSACLIITYEDGTRIIKTIKESETMRVQQLFADQMATEQKATEHFAFSRAGIGKWAPNWRHKTISMQYGPTEKAHYEKLYALIIPKIESIMRSEQQKRFTIIDGGCGNGDLIVAVKDSNEAKQLSANYLGFDFNKENIVDCNKHGSNIKFEEGDLLNIDKILAENKFKGDNSSILILSGSVTDQVLPHAFQAVEVLQKAARSNVEYLIGGGVGEPLFTDHMAKRIGYKKISVTDKKNSELNFFTYKKLSPEVILQNKINKVKKNNFLDLSFSPNPEEILQQLLRGNHLNNNLTIDLSYCSFNNELKAALSEIVKTFHNIKLIYWHRHADYSPSSQDRTDPVAEFVEYFKLNPELTNNFPLASISSHALREQAYMMAPKSFFMALHDVGSHREGNKDGFSNPAIQALEEARRFMHVSREAVVTSQMKGKHSP